MKLNFRNITFMFGASVAMVSCTRHEDSPGYEYMPDMYRSQAIEAYVDYGLVSDDENDTLKNTMSARTPSFGTIPFNANQEMAAVFMPYSMDDTAYVGSKNVLIPEMYIESEDIASGFADEGKVLYAHFCMHCHGKKGGGDGAVITKGEYNAPNPYSGGYKDRTLGQIFHVITNGKGAMGPHASQVNKDERWKIALYVRTLQWGSLEFEALKYETDSLRMIQDSVKTNLMKVSDIDSLSINLDGSLDLKETIGHNNGH